MGIISVRLCPHSGQVISESRVRSSVNSLFGDISNIVDHFLDLIEYNLVGVIFHFHILVLIARLRRMHVLQFLKRFIYMCCAAFTGRSLNFDYHRFALRNAFT